MNVVPIEKRANRETVALLKTLAAKAEAGEIVGVAVCVMNRQGGAQAAFAGTYRERPAEGVNAALRLSWALTRAQDMMNGST